MDVGDPRRAAWDYLRKGVILCEVGKARQAVIAFFERGCVAIAPGGDVVSKSREFWAESCVMVNAGAANDEVGVEGVLRRVEAHAAVDHACIGPGAVDMHGEIRKGGDA